MSPLTRLPGRCFTLVTTAVPGVFGIPGGSWGSSPDKSGGQWGYYVPQGQGTRKVDTSHVSEELAGLIQCLTPELALPWGFLIVEGGTASLVDVPYFSEGLVEEISKVAPGGLANIFFTHSDFVGMAEPGNWSEACPRVKIVAHHADCIAEGITDKLDGAGPWHIGAYRIDAVPGHTEGSVVISSAARNVSFGGDSMGFWEGRPTGYPKMARHSCRRQAQSLRKIADAPFFKFWLPGHGLPLQFECLEDRRRQLYAAAEELENLSASVSAP